MLYYNQKEGRTKPLTKGENKMIRGLACDREWYEEIKDRVECTEVYFYTDKRYGEMAEFRADEEEFDKVSRELGWM